MCVLVVMGVCIVMCDGVECVVNIVYVSIVECGVMWWCVDV